ncbi:MAG: hypothetical protein HYY93_16185 [Planctomycetes bacterium]|nr:hypothetical protein [Planctomycetota bacterium]
MDPRLTSITGADSRGRLSPAPSGRPSAASGPSFATVLRKAIDTAPAGPVKFSGHAQERLASRGIELSADDLDAIGAALGKAQAKGARDTLVLLRDLGFIVSIPNRTVVTALDRADLRDRVFTHLDSTVIAG